MLFRSVQNFQIDCWICPGGNHKRYIVPNCIHSRAKAQSPGAVRRKLHCSVLNFACITSQKKKAHNILCTINKPMTSAVRRMDVLVLFIDRMVTNCLRTCFTTFQTQTLIYIIVEEKYILFFTACQEKFFAFTHPARRRFGGRGTSQ